MQKLSWDSVIGVGREEPLPLSPSPPREGEPRPGILARGEGSSAPSPRGRGGWGVRSSLHQRSTQLYHLIAQLRRLLELQRLRRQLHLRLQRLDHARDLVFGQVGDGDGSGGLLIALLG